jgi:hypothetical protein
MSASDPALDEGGNISAQDDQLAASNHDEA